MEQQDCWANRLSGMVCATCMFFVKKDPNANVPLDTKGAIGRCRRHSPTMSGFPVVYQKDWCGDHKLNENA